MAQTYTLTVNIEKGGTITHETNGTTGSSIAGHMWYSISDGTTVGSKNFGFAPDQLHEGKPFAPGSTYNHDDIHYDGDAAYSKTITITQEQYDQLMTFGEQPQNFGFDMYYNVLTNSCIDFVWKALDEAGLNPTHYQGDLIPMWNADNIDRLFNKQPIVQNSTWTDTNGITYQTSYSYTNGIVTKESWHGSDGSSGTYDYTNGASSGNVTYADKSGYSYSNDGSDNVQVKNFDSTGKITEIDWSKADGSYGSTVLNTDGTITSTATSIDGTTTTTTSEPSGLQNLIDGFSNFKNDINNSDVGQAINTYGTRIIDSLTLIKAIQSGQPLPITASGLRLANDMSKGTNITLSGASSIASGVLSVMSLDAALKRGDTLGAINATAQTIDFAAHSYQAFVSQSSEMAKTTVEFLEGGEKVVNGVTTKFTGALAYLSLAVSIERGDAVGIAISAIAIIQPELGVPLMIAYSIYSIIDGLFGGDDIPDPWGTGRFVWDGTNVTYQSAGETGGNEAVGGLMQNILSALNTMIAMEQKANPDAPLGIIPNRMPTIGYDMSGYRYTDIDPMTGEEKHPGLRFDTSGNPYNATPGTPESYQSIGEAIVRAALVRGAIAPMWEVRTAKIQTDFGDPKAGLTEEERAAREGKLAPAVTADTQVFRPVVIDLSGDGIRVIDKSVSAANFDIDNSGFLKKTAWIDGDDAFLTLDRNFNGVVDGGKEMFSNAAVSLDRRGLTGMAWIDSNYDGKITVDDPVWNALKVWQDGNGDGQEQATEIFSLNALGISELNYAMGTFTQNGVKKQLSSPDLEADTAGVQVNVVPEGIIVTTSDGNTSLIVDGVYDLSQNNLPTTMTVNNVSDYSAIQAGMDGIIGYEDVELIINEQALLANDSINGVTGQDLTVTGVTNFRHGTVTMDANGYVHFKPEADYAGSDAGFDYIVEGTVPVVSVPTDPTTVPVDTTVTGTGTVQIALRNVNDAPTATDARTIRPVYAYRFASGYDQAYYSYQAVQSGLPQSTYAQPIYEPYTTSATSYQIINGNLKSVTTTTLHDTPVAYEDTGSGQIVGSDIDDPASSLTYEIVGQPQYGAITMDAQGNYVYTSWSSPGVSTVSASKPLGAYGSMKPETDSFQVKVSDPHGASTVKTITVPHIGYYTPPTPPGGGGKKPIAVDLNGDGFHFEKVDDSNVFFDVTGDGWKRRTAWVSSGDGLLAYDRDGNGKIETSGEISFVGYSNGAQSDLEGLKGFDTNGDGIFSALDEKWSKFGIWQDANGDGITDDGEFNTLDQMGVTAIALTSDGKFSVIDGQTVHGVGSMQLANGSTMAIADVTLEYANETQVHYSDGTTSTVAASPFSPNGEEIDGTEEKDLILGKNGNNSINAYGGDDVIFDDGGNDLIDAGAGNDIVYSGADNDIVMGGAGDDMVYAGVGDDMVFGGDGHDAIFAEGGNDVVFGGDGNDMISGGDGNDVLSGDAGNDQVYGEAGNDALFGRDGNDQLFGMDGNDLLNGGTGNDLLDGGAGADTMSGGTGDDTYVVDDTGDTVTEAADEGNDTVISMIDYTLAATLENLTLGGSENLAGIGNNTDNLLIGNVGDNVLVGNGGNDTLNGGMGADTMKGGVGDDVYIVDNASDVVIEYANEGTDTVRASVSYTLLANVENLILTGSSSIDATGNTLDNTLIGNSGNNILDGGMGIDTLIGGAGDDVYIVDSVDDTVVEYAGEGVDMIRSSVTRTLEETVENLVLTGATAVDGTGNAMSNILIGNDAANTLDGQEGADAMAGGSGDDTYIVDNIGDTVYEVIGAGEDLVKSSVTYTLSNNVERLILTGSAAINGIGNNLDNALTGNDGNNVLDGQAGADTMKGGTGDDTYVVDNIADQVVEAAAEGYDTVLSGVSYGLSADVETLILTGTTAIDGTGNDLDNILIGNDVANTLDGRAGVDTMKGGGGDDTYVVDNATDMIIELVGEGMDTVYTSVSYALSDNVENLILTGNGDLSLGGNALDNTLIGNSGNNVISAGAGNDLLDGRDGNDTLDGGLGDDTYRINLGDGLDSILDTGGTDTVALGSGLSLDNVALRVVTVNGVATAQVRVLNAGGCEQPDQGFDFAVTTDTKGNYISPIERFTFSDGSTKSFNDLLIKTRVTYGSVFQPVMSTGRDDDIIYAGPRNNVIYAGSGNDVVYAGSGGDAVYGEGGNDLLEGSNGDDMMDGGCGIDILEGGVGNDTLIDTYGNNALLGGYQNDTISAGAGNDFIAGGMQDDTLSGGSGYNIFAFDRNDGRDVILPFAGAHNVLSLGNIDERNLTLRKNGNDLVMVTGYGSQITLQGWYDGTVNQNVETLQMMTKTSSYRHSDDITVDTFDFRALVNAFDQARSANAHLNQWSMMNSLLNAHLSSSETTALGGDLAVNYARTGDLSAMSLSSAQTTLKDPSFAVQAQALQPWGVTACR